MKTKEHIKQPKTKSKPNDRHSFFKPALASIQRKCEHCEEEEKQKLQRKESTAETTGISPQTENYISSLNGKGGPMSEGDKKFFEPRLGYDFSNVQLHTDSEAGQSAKSINALAYTHGNNIVFGDGQYKPGTENGKKLLAHELAHVVQQQSNVGLKPVQRYIQPGDRGGAVTPPVTKEVAQHQTETISNAPDPRWNGPFQIDSYFQVMYDASTQRATIVSRLYSVVEDNVKAGWKNAIESRWGLGQFQLEVWESCTPRVIPIDVNIQWVNDPLQAHYVIKAVHPGDTVDGGKTMGVGGTMNMTTWGTANYTDVPHEYGHMLGNPEEYFTTNGVDYTYGGTKSGYRDRGGGIMNNPSEAPSPRHYNVVKNAFVQMMNTPPAMTRVVQRGSVNPPLMKCGSSAQQNRLPSD